MSDGRVSTPVLLCLGEALVDLVGEAWVSDMSEVPAFVPHLGGTVANVAVAAARAGAPVALAGGAGSDEWGRWLAGRLASQGVGVSRFVLLPGVDTQLAFVAVAPGGEPRYALYGERVESVGVALGEAAGEAVAGAAAVLVNSNSLVGAGERAATLRARDLALELGRPVVFDCNLRLHRWASREEAVATARGCVPGAALVRANRDEAEVLTGESDPERAAEALHAAGAELVAITLGSDGAILRGARRADVAALPARVRSTMGAGDAFTGVLAARLCLAGFDPAAAVAGLEEAAMAAARACEHWGSLD